jgi:sigma-B regulation protein RsbU (phosphoserine phosphatase)
MALGVEEGSPIEGKHTQLEPGDFLILYTDGITEAFAPDGDLYGEERLHQTIWSTGVCATNSDNPEAFSAQDMLEAIDQSVAGFINDAALSDDLTLVVLKRSPDVGGTRPAI